MTVEHGCPSPGPRASVAPYVLACVAAAAFLTTVGCVPGGIGGLVTVDVARVRVEPHFNGEGTDPADPFIFPGEEWHEDRNATTVAYAVRLPRGLELGAAVGAAYYGVAWGELLGHEDGVLVWKAMVAWQRGSRTIFRLCGHYEAVEDRHVLDHKDAPGEQQYEFSEWALRTSLGRTLGSFGLHVGVQHAETTSRFIRTGTFANDFGLASEKTTVFVSIESVEVERGVFGGIEAGGTPGDDFDTYRLTTSVGVSF
ncbi:MAG: hypothetical protein ACYTKD_29365 [Planctomycetota bacterium]